MDGAGDGLVEGLGGGDVVDETSNRDNLSLVASFLPGSEDGGDEVSSEVAVKHLGEKVDVRNEGAHQDDGHVGGVEETDGVGSIRSGLIVGQFESHLESLEVDDNQEHEDSTQDVADVWKRISEEGILDGSQLVISEENSIEELNKGTLVLLDVSGAALILERQRREAVPNDGLSHVDRDEDGGSRVANTIALAQHVVEKDGDEGGEGQLQDNQDGISSTNLRDVSVHSGPGVGEGLSESNQNTGQFLCALVKSLFFLIALINLDKLGSTEELHDHGGSNNRRDTEFHKSTTVGGKDGSHPVEGISLVVLDDAEKGDLATKQVNEHNDAGPDLLGVEGDLNRVVSTAPRGGSISGIMAMAGLRI